METGYLLADAHRVNQVKLSAQIQRLLGEVYRRTIDPRRLDETFPVFARAAEVALSQGRTASDALARRYYAESARAAGFKPEALDLPRTPMNLEAVETSLRVTGPVLIKTKVAEGVPLNVAQQAGLAATIAAGKRIVLDGGRDMLIQASRRDTHVEAWARVSDGGPCAFCAMLVSRGPVYSEGTVSFRSHDRCGCGVRLVYENDADGGWGPDAKTLRSLWNDAGDLPEFRKALRQARSNPDSPLFTVPSTPTKPWADAVTAAKARMPKDLAKIGTKEVQVAGEGALEAKFQELYRLHGGDLPTLQRKVDTLKQQLDDWDAIEAYFRSHGVPDKWPADYDLLAAVRRQGLTRRKPVTIYRAFSTERDKLWRMHWEAEGELNTLKSRMAFVREQAVGNTLKRVDDLDDFGRLGAESSDALDAVLDAGKALDEELQRRLARRGPKGPNYAIEEADAYARYRAIHREYLKAKATATGPELDELIRKLGKAGNDWTELRPKAKEWRAQRSAVMREEAAALLADVRKMGGGKLPAYARGTGYTSEALDAMARAHSMYPDDWNTLLSTRFPDMKLGVTDRGYNQGGHTIMLSVDRDHSGTGPLGHVSIHELGHSMEAVVPGLKGLEWAFHYRRSNKILTDGVEKLAPLTDIYGNGREFAYEDRWASTYTGKSYRDRNPEAPGADSSWEVFQTGVESVFEGSPYFDRGATLGDDAEFRQFILGVMSVL